MAKELVGIFLGSSIAIGLVCCFRQKESERKTEPKRHGKSDQAITLATTEGDMLPKNAKKAASLQPVSKKKTTRKGSRDKPTHVVPACNKVKEKTLALHTLDATTDKDLKQSGYVVSNTVDPSRFTGTKTKPTIGKTATDATLDKALMNDQGYEASVTCDTSQAKTAVSKQEKVCQQENGQSPLCKSEANSTYSAVLAPQKPTEDKELPQSPSKSPATSSKAGDADANLANDNIGLGCGW